MPETTVESGQTVDNIVLNSGDYQHVAGTANNTVVNLGGGQLVYQGTTNYTVVNSGAYQVVTDGIVNNTIVNDGGHLTLYEGATSNNVLLNGGSEALSAPTSVAIATVIESGGSQVIDTGRTDGTIIGNNGNQYITASTVYHVAPVVENTTVTSGGTQSIDLSNGSVSVTGTRLLTGGHIQLTGFGQNGNTSVTFSQATNILTFQSGSQTFNLQLAGNYNGTAFDFTSYGNSTSVSVLCFCRGTGIRTPVGDVPVEQLRVGDEVVTVSGRRRPIRWIGSTAAITNERNRPVVIRAGAFGGGAPYRDVRVTRSHSFLFGDVLIPIEQLVNGTTIQFEWSTRAMELFHVELDQHDILLADGAPAESFRDIGNRSGLGHVDGSEQSRAGSMPTYAPLVYTGPIVERTRRRLAEWAGTVPEPSVRHSPIVRGSELVSSAIS